MNPHNHNNVKELKEWQKLLNSDTREKFTKNFIDSLMIVNFSTWIMFQKYLHLFDKMENDAYMESDTRAEYYCKVAQETYKIYDLIRDENNLTVDIEHLNLNDNNEGQPITNKNDLDIIEDCIKFNLRINDDCSAIETCDHVKCATKRNILRHLITCSSGKCNTPFCNASKHFLKNNN